MLNYKILILNLLLCAIGFSQRLPDHIIISGTILSYTYDDTKSIFKREKQIEVEGSLPNAILDVTDAQNYRITKTESDLGGKFSFKLQLGKIYLVTFKKNGYGTSAFQVDLTGIPEEYSEWGMLIQNLDLILNNFESEKAQDNGESFGRIYFDVTKEEFVFKATEFNEKKRLFDRDEDNTCVSLMQTSIKKNRELNKLDNRVEVEVTEPVKQESNRRRPSTTHQTVTVDTVQNHTENFKQTKEKIEKHSQLDFLRSDFGEDDIVAFEKQLKTTRAELEADRLSAVTELDFLSIAARERMLNTAEKQLGNAKLFIKNQRQTIEAQQSFIYALIGVAILLVIFAFFVIRAYREKRRNHALLAEKNRKISESIHYALRIQQSVLLSDQQVKAILPKSVIFYRPLDAVSGDFYWFTKLETKIIMAAVDCTGHGVPGAFMSLIGNTLMNQIVNEKGITQPGNILKELHEGIVRSLNQTDDEEAAQDGMDISICCYDTNLGKLTFAGANNAVYIVQDNEIITLQASPLTVGGYVRKNREVTFSERELTVKKGDRIYLFSDGYMDQFGGEKDEKYNISRFKSLLLSMKNSPMTEQESGLKQSFEAWKGKTTQTDDVLVIGVEI